MKNVKIPESFLQIRAKRCAYKILEGAEIRKTLSEGYFSELVIDLQDKIQKKLNDLKQEDPLFNDTEHKSYKQNKKDFDDFIKELDGFGVDTKTMLNKITQGKQNLRWADVWNGIISNIVN